MPFDFAFAATMPIDAECIHGVSRCDLVAHAMEQIAPALRAAVVEMDVASGTPFVHGGMMFEQVAWRAAWGRPGLPVARGSFPVWNGRPV